MKRMILSTIMVITLLCSSFSGIAIGADVSSSKEVEESYWADVLKEIKYTPITSLELRGKKAQYEYTDGKRTKSVYENGSVEYVYQNGVLIEEKGNEVFGFIYVDEKCVGIENQGVVYTFLFDELGSVSGIQNKDGNVICYYNYDGALARETIVTNNANEMTVAKKNPIRYLGWHFDSETALYYLGEGVFYDAISQEYIAEVDYPTTASRSTKARALSNEPAIIQQITDAYVAMLQMPSYGSKKYEPPKESEWNNGKRWYNGVAQIELIARCIYAENTNENRSDDRKAIGTVIANRVNQNFPHNGALTAYNIVTFPAAFSTINPNSYAKSVSETGNARIIMDKTKLAVKQATLIACCLYYSTDRSVYQSVVGTASYVGNAHTHFLSANYAKQVFSVTYENGVAQWWYNNKKIYDVSIAGVTQLQSLNGTDQYALSQYVNRGYNVFYRY